MARTSNVFARVEPEIKEQAERVLDQLGIPMSNAVGMFLRQVVLQQGIPFEMKLPKKAPLFPQRTARSSPMIVATAPSIFSVDFSLSALILPAGSVRMKMLSIIHRRTGCPPWAIICSSTSFISSLVGGDISLKFYRVVCGIFGGSLYGCFYSIRL